MWLYQGQLTGREVQEKHTHNSFKLTKMVQLGLVLAQRPQRERSARAPGRGQPAAPQPRLLSEPSPATLLLFFFPRSRSRPKKKGAKEKKGKEREKTERKNNPSPFVFLFLSFLLFSSSQVFLFPRDERCACCVLQKGPRATMGGDDIPATDVSEINRQIDQLLQCKPLTELEVKELCDKVRGGVPLLLPIWVLTLLSFLWTVPDFALPLRL
jgi:hypothetical protein